jgi:pimeloyl-ACP methyl ester carboxylesterase
MTNPQAVGPFRTIDLGNGTTAPWYVIPFDKRGRSTAPRTRDHLVHAAADSTVTNIVIFAHGWNTNWNDAIGLSDSFFRGYLSTRVASAPSGPFKPIFISIFWPSIALLWGEEQAPQIAAAGATSGDLESARRALEDLAEQLPAANVARFYDLVQHENGLSRAEALELAGIVAPLYRTKHDDLRRRLATPSAKDLVAAWRLAFSRGLSRDTSDEPGTVDDGEEIGTVDDEPAAGPQAAGDVGGFDPRDIVRLLTMWQMKDRAGTVGAYGVGPLISDLLAASAARLHLVGHSFGGKVVLSAIAIKALSRQVSSVLLLQPAISHLCFATSLPETNRQGGYRVALQRVAQPILSTFSANDAPLHSYFHLAATRSADLGDVQIAAAGAPPNLYAALGGYGPRGCDADCETIELKDVGDAYTLNVKVPEIYALDGLRSISSHGDISNRFTWWALHNQVSATL